MIIRLQPSPVLHNTSKQCIIRIFFIFTCRYHSAPSVIDEVIHRRDWERSTRDLYIPLNPDNELAKSVSSPSLEIAPYAEPESSSIEGLKPDEHKPRKLCKKHYTNIKSSKGKKCKESNRDDIKDTDATETLELSNFYIGDGHEDSSLLTKASSLNPEDSAIMTRASTSNYDDLVEYERLSEERNRSIYKVKEAKQSFNESIRLKEKPRKSLVPVTEGEVRFGFCLDEDVEASDRSGAVHHSIESRTSLRHYPPPSVGKLTLLLARKHMLCYLTYRFRFCLQESYRYDAQPVQLYSLKSTTYTNK